MYKVYFEITSESIPRSMKNHVKSTLQKIVRGPFTGPKSKRNLKNKKMHIYKYINIYIYIQRERIVQKIDAKSDASNAA